MTMYLDHTHNPLRRSWVGSANDQDTDFPIQNLPLGIFAIGGEAPRCGAAIGDQILDLRLAMERGLIREPAAKAVTSATLDALFALGQAAMRDLRHDIFSILDADSPPDEALLHPMADCELHLPTSVRSFTDFYVGIHHACRSAELLGQTANPLPHNYHHMPLGYNGRASSVQVSGTPVRRPVALRKLIGDTEPSYGPSQWFDFELEIGFFIGSGNRLGDPIAIGNAAEHIAGYCLLNDWSARDIQLFEMGMMGAVNSKSMGTSISPWVITADAMEPFRMSAMERFAAAPPTPDYLHDKVDQQVGGIDIALSAMIGTERMRAQGQQSAPLMQSLSRYLYWTCAQIVAQLSVNGCNMVPGDLIGTGTISGPEQAQSASLFELSAGGRRPIKLPNGEHRTFLEDGDEISFRGRCERDGFASIGFGSCSGRITPADDQ